MNEMQRYAHVFDDVPRWKGTPPKGFMVDFLGVLTASRFRLAFGRNPETDGGRYTETRHPNMADGEGWFEAFNWVEAARAARDRYTMVSLGACYGAQAVGACAALRIINPMPYRLVTVEAEPGHNVWLADHYRDNAIDPDQQWIINAAISDSNQPVFFPVGATDLGGHNAISTNNARVRRSYFEQFVARGETEPALEALLLRNSTGLAKSIRPQGDHIAEVKLVSAVTLGDVLGPLDFVDYLEADMQQSEAIVFPPNMELMSRKVRRAHLGTHGQEVHGQMVSLFRDHGWEIAFAFGPDTRHETELGNFVTSDGVLTATNPRLA